MANGTNRCAILANSDAFQARVRIVAAYYAQTVMGEGTGVANHTERLALATKVLKNQGPIYPLTTMLVADTAIATTLGAAADDTVATLEAALTDATILTRIQTIWTNAALSGM